MMSQGAANTIATFGSLVGVAVAVATGAYFYTNLERDLRDLRNTVENQALQLEAQSAAVNAMSAGTGRGPRGERGPAGPKGDRGPRGERGPQGEPGVAGKSTTNGRLASVAVRAIAKTPKGVDGKRVYTKSGVSFSVSLCGRRKYTRSHSGWGGGIFCKYRISNLTANDKEICLGMLSRLTTQSGVSFSGKHHAYVGSKNGILNQQFLPKVCDVLPPRVTTTGEIIFPISGRDEDSIKVQFVRLDCGRGCKYDAYGIPIK